MTTTRWLRISSIIALLFAIGHMLGGLQYWSPTGDNPVLQAMRTVVFDVMGVKRSYFEFYIGFGYALAVAQVMQAILLWQLATLAQADARRIRPMVAVIALAMLATAVIAWRFILPVPAAFTLVLTATLTVAYVLAR